MRFGRLRFYSGAICFSVFSVLFGLLVVMWFIPLYRISIPLFDIPAETGLSPNALMINYRALMEYLLNPFVKELQMPDFPSSGNALIHFFEVKQLFMISHVAFVLSLPITYWWLKKIKQHQIWLLTESYIKWFSGIASILVVVCLLNFEQAFIMFHHLFFNNDYWLFDPTTDPIITALPEGFFALMGAIVVLVVVACHLVLYWYCKRKAF